MPPLGRGARCQGRLTASLGDAMGNEVSVMALAIGGGAAAGVGVFAHAVGYDRDRAFFPTVLTVVGAMYVLFATMAGGGPALFHELVGLLAFGALAAIGFRTSLWLVAAGLALHGLFDFARDAYFAAPGAPHWWPEFCGAYDIIAALGLALLLRQRAASPA